MKKIGKTKIFLGFPEGNYPFKDISTKTRLLKLNAFQFNPLSANPTKWSNTLNSLA